MRLTEEATPGSRLVVVGTLLCPPASMFTTELHPLQPPPQPLLSLPQTSPSSMTHPSAAGPTLLQCEWVIGVCGELLVIWGSGSYVLCSGVPFTTAESEMHSHNFMNWAVQVAAKWLWDTLSLWGFKNRKAIRYQTALLFWDSGEAKCQPPLQGQQ